MKLTMLGTGGALVTKCFNTCFVLANDGKFLLVDGGGGNQLFNQLEKSQIPWQHIHEIVVTHKHIDHLLGIVWFIRKVCQAINNGKYDGKLIIYSANEVLEILQSIVTMLLQGKEIKHIGDRVLLQKVCDGEMIDIIGNKTEFFDIHSTKALQYGFVMNYAEKKKLVCYGDEPCTEQTKHFALNADWVLHEAFCLYAEKDIFKPYEKHHSTVKDACEMAEELKVKNLVLYHTEDKHISDRKKLYTIEGKMYYNGHLFVPNDLEQIEIN